MMRRIAIVAGIALALATTAWAQDNVTGRVKFYDPASRVLTLEDGRIVHLESGSTITVGGRRVTVDTLTPGTVVSVQQVPVAVPSTTVVAQPWVGHPAVDATGVVSTYDRQTGLVTFQDGRTMRVTDQTRLWEEKKRTTGIQPGDRIMLSNAMPVGYTGVGATTTTTVVGRQYMGTVRSIDASRSYVVLTDGRVVSVTPGTRYVMDDRVITIGDLRPGDQIIVTTTDGGQTVVSGGAPGTTVVTQPGVTIGDNPSAMPRPGQAVSIAASEVRILRRPEAP